MFFQKNGLSDAYLRQYVPAVFATAPYHKMSARFVTYPTGDIVTALRDEGFLPVSAMQAKSRADDRYGFAKHTVTFRKAGELTVLGEGLPTFTITNAADGSAAYRLIWGFLRLVCTNGMMRSERGAQFRYRHTLTVVTEIVEGTIALARQSEMIADEIAQMRDIELTQPERLHLAERALSLRYPAGDPHGSTLRFRPEDFLIPRRAEDYGNSLWITLNVIQWYMMNGGVRGLTEKDKEKKARPINGIWQTVHLNTGLWAEAEAIRAERFGARAEPVVVDADPVLA